MFKKKCPNCAKKIEKSFGFCPHCGFSFRKQNEEEEFGLIGRDDFLAGSMPGNEMKLPLGLNKIMSTLMKQIEKELGGIQGSQPNRGFNIQISTGPGQQKTREVPVQKINNMVLDDREIERRKDLQRQEPQSNVRRLSDRIVYEINVPGVKSKEDIIITKLENSLEIKAYSKDSCYIKTIPIKSDILKYSIKDGTLLLELKS